MPSCPRCFALIDGGSSYCGICGRPRIVESLRNPVVRPFWFKPALQALGALIALWFVVTLGVAFLREAKAVRLSRKLLEAGQPQEAWPLLQPFLPDHPKHRQALFLCGKATIRLGLKDDAKQCLERVSALSPELGKALGDDYRQILAQQARALGCNIESFKGLLASAEELGPPYAASVLSGLDGVVEGCRAARNEYAPWQFAAMLGEKGQKVSLAEKGYVPAVNRALAQARYADARALAQQAVNVAPEGAGAVEAALDGERNKVSKTVETLRQLCTSLKADARYHPGATWCFPVTAPPQVEAARDGWGRSVVYSPLVPDSTQKCHQGFALTSYGGDGVPTKGNLQSPAADIICRVVSGGESWQQPNEFWRIQEGG